MGTNGQDAHQRNVLIQECPEAAPLQKGQHECAEVRIVYVSSWVVRYGNAVNRCPMRGSNRSWVIGLSLGLLYFVLEAADVEIPDPLLWMLGVVAVGSLLYGFIGLLKQRRAKARGAPEDVTNSSSGGPIIGVINAGRDVLLAAASTPDAQQGRHLTLHIEEREPQKISNWNHDWRVTIRVTNMSNTADVSAYLLAPTGGLADPDYGDINLQWDSVATNFSTLVTHKPERLHIARISDSGIVRFLSPGQFAGERREYQQNPIKITDSPIRGRLMFSAKEGGCEQRPLEIHLDHDNKPTVHVGEPEPC